MAKRLKWLTLSPLAASELPNDITFTIKKPFFTASVVLSYRLSSATAASSGDLAGDAVPNHTTPLQIFADSSLEATVPILGTIHYSIQASSVPLQALSEPTASHHNSTTAVPADLRSIFGFETSLERDEAKGSYRKVTARGNTLSLESKSASGEPTTKTREISLVPPSPLLVHLMTLPALIASREADTDIYVAQLVNGLKIQALRLDRVSANEQLETFRGRIRSIPSELSEDEFRDLSWENVTSFEFDFDAMKKTISAARLQLPIIGKIEIKG